MLQISSARYTLFHVFMPLYLFSCVVCLLWSVHEKCLALKMNIFPFYVLIIYCFYWTTHNRLAECLRLARFLLEFLGQLIREQLSLFMHSHVCTNATQTTTILRLEATCKLNNCILVFSSVENSQWIASRRNAFAILIIWHFFFVSSDGDVLVKCAAKREKNDNNNRR